MEGVEIPSSRFAVILPAEHHFGVWVLNVFIPLPIAQCVANTVEAISPDCRCLRNCSLGKYPSSHMLGNWWKQVPVSPSQATAVTESIRAAGGPL